MGRPSRGEPGADQYAAPMNLKKGIVAIVLLVLVCSALLFALYLTRVQPVLFEFGEPGDPRGPVWSFLHPFRDRDPERVSETFLMDLKQGRYDRALSRLVLTDEARSEIRQREKDHQLQKCRLIYRTDSSNEVKLSYTCSRGGSPGSESPIWITVVRSEAGGEWRLHKYEAWY